MNCDGPSNAEVDPMFEEEFVDQGCSGGLQDGVVSLNVLTEVPRVIKVDPKSLDVLGCPMSLVVHYVEDDPSLGDKGLVHHLADGLGVEGTSRLHGGSVGH